MQAVKLAKADPQMWTIFESQREERERVFQEEQRLRKQSRGMFAEFFSDLVYHVLLILSSFLPFVPPTLRRGGASATSSSPAREGGSRTENESMHIDELSFKLLQEELNNEPADTGDYFNARFTLVHVPTSSTVRDVKMRLFHKYGLTPERIRLCQIVDLTGDEAQKPSQANTASGSSSEAEREDQEWDAEVREMPDESTLAEYDSLQMRSLLYVDAAVV